MSSACNLNCNLVFVLRFLSGVWWTRIISNTIAACVNVLFIQLIRNMTGLARRNIVSLISLIGGGMITVKIQNILFNLSSIKQFRQSGPVGLLLLE